MTFSSFFSCPISLETDGFGVKTLLTCSFVLTIFLLICFSGSIVVSLTWSIVVLLTSFSESILVLLICFSGSIQHKLSVVKHQAVVNSFKQ